MPKFEYCPEKDVKIRKERGVGFDEIIMLIGDGYLLDVLEHPNQEDYPGQKVYVVEIEGYVWLVPYVQSNSTIFLKTAFPSRKQTKKYTEEKNGKKA